MKSHQKRLCCVSFLLRDGLLEREEVIEYLQAEGMDASDEVRKRHFCAILRHFDTQNDHFTKTGSGQT